MRMFLYALFVVTILVLLTSSCGRSDDLGSVGGVSITTEDFLAVFNNIPADMQVSVLEPGGRLKLMNRIVMKRSLLTAWEEDRTVSAGWEDLYRISMLADSMFNRIGFAFDQQGYIDSLTSCGYSGFTLRVVLLDDSVAASEMAEMWNSGNFDAPVLSMSAPWSLADGSSYRNFSGPVHRITSFFVPLVTMDTGTAHVLPMYGEWCVCLLNLAEGDWVPEDGVGSLGFMNAITAQAHSTIFSKGISALADNCILSGTVIVPAGDGNQEPVVVFSSDTLTVADIIDVMKKGDSVNFPGDTPDEISAFSPPQLITTTEVTLWFYVKHLAQKYSLSEIAIEQGVVLPENALDFARAESVIRSRVLEASIPDSAGVAAWFEDNSEMFLVPERRSVLLGYTDSSVVLDSETFSSFEELPPCQTIVDQDGTMISTPHQVEQAFGAVLGPAIFAADSGVFSGPVFLEGELAAWFEVVEIIPPEIASLEVAYSHAELLAASTMFSSRFDSLMNDFYTRYSVTIDTAAVTEIDLWGGTQ
ncbi:MAG: peptidyl-prolyl cis-trans isomerase [Candidatus Sabulitectum sp.]|nr:peptidyl-prolyl cis-trans isomerase [Candidatus Sabulitectum sp.]